MHNTMFNHTKSVLQQRKNYIEYIRKYHSMYENILNDVCLETYCLIYSNIFSEIHGIFYTPDGLVIILRKTGSTSTYRIQDLDVFTLKSIVLSLKKEFGRIPKNK